MSGQFSLCRDDCAVRAALKYPTGRGRKRRERDGQCRSRQISCASRYGKSGRQLLLAYRERLVPRAMDGDGLRVALKRFCGDYSDLALRKNRGHDDKVGRGQKQHPT